MYKLRLYQGGGRNLPIDKGVCCARGETKPEEEGLRGVGRVARKRKALEEEGGRRRKASEEEGREGGRGTKEEGARGARLRRKTTTGGGKGAVGVGGLLQGMDVRKMVQGLGIGFFIFVDS